MIGSLIVAGCVLAGLIVLMLLGACAMSGRISEAEERAGVARRS